MSTGNGVTGMNRRQHFLLARSKQRSMHINVSPSHQNCLWHYICNRQKQSKYEKKRRKFKNK